LPETQVDVESAMFIDNDGNPIIGFCLWCNKDFYSLEDAEAHNADRSKACPAFQDLRDEGCG
jgi:hypothetical protein